MLEHWTPAREKNQKQQCIAFPWKKKEREERLPDFAELTPKQMKLE